MACTPHHQFSSGMERLGDHSDDLRPYIDGKGHNIDAGAICWAAVAEAGGQRGYGISGDGGHAFRAWDS